MAKKLILIVLVVAVIGFIIYFIAKPKAPAAPGGYVHPTPPPSGGGISIDLGSLFSGWGKNSGTGTSGNGSGSSGSGSGSSGISEPPADWLPGFEDGERVNYQGHIWESNNSSWTLIS